MHICEAEEWSLKEETKCGNFYSIKKLTRSEQKMEKILKILNSKSWMPMIWSLPNVSHLFLLTLNGDDVANAPPFNGLTANLWIFLVSQNE